MSTFTRTIWLLAALLTTPLAQALGLGGLTGNGALGEPLDAYVSLYLAPGERTTLKSVEVLPDMFARDESNTLSTLRATLESDSRNTFIHVTSDVPLRVERLQFRLRVNTTRGAVIGRYAVRAPSRAQAALTSAEQRTRVTARDTFTNIVARPTPTVAAPTTAGSATYGPVRSGESLWTIARQFTNGSDVQSVMRTLHRLNPAAFVNGDIDRLRAGVVLSVPDEFGAAGDAGVTGASDAPSDTTANDTNASDSVGRATPATPTSSRVANDSAAAIDELDALLDDPTAVDTARDDDARRATTEASPMIAPTNNAAVDSSSSAGSSALAAELAALDAKFAAIRAKYGKPGVATSAAIATTSTPVATPAPTNTASVTATSAAAPAAAITPSAPAAAAIHDRTVPRPAVAEAGRADGTVTSSPPVAGSDLHLPAWLPKAALAALLLAAVLASLPQLNRRLVGFRTRTTAASVKAADADRKAEVARKAESRVRLESEIEGLLKRKREIPEAAAPAAAMAAPTASVITHPPVSPYEQTLDALAATSGGALLENDREVAIDANIAHGRYAEAEALLLEVIGAHPRNVQAKLRLAEVYYITEKLDGFASVALDMKDHHRGDMTDEEWQRVVRMGKIIAPDLALFSGPKAVGKRA